MADRTNSLPASFEGEVVDAVASYSAADDSQPVLRGAPVAEYHHTIQDLADQIQQHEGTVRSNTDATVQNPDDVAGADAAYGEEYDGARDEGVDGATEVESANGIAETYDQQAGQENASVVGYTAEDDVLGDSNPATGAADAGDHASAMTGEQHHACIDDDLDSEHVSRDRSSGRAPGRAQVSREEHAKANAPYTRTPDMLVSHKLAERRRRKEMRELFDELRDQIPGEEGSKASKWEVLSKAIEHVNALQQERDSLFHEVQALRATVGHTSAGEEEAQRIDAEQYDGQHGHARAEGDNEEYRYENEQAYVEESEGGDAAGQHEHYQEEHVGEHEPSGTQAEQQQQQNATQEAQESWSSAIAA